MTVQVNVGGVEYTVDESTRSIVPDDPIAGWVAALLDSGEPIGPQIDEWVGVTGDWDEAPLSVQAAFMDAADALNLRVSKFEVRAPAPVTAAVRPVGRAEGGFDELGNWHDPGSGEFAKPGMSTAKGVILETFRRMLADARRDGHVAARLTGDLPHVGRHGDSFDVAWHDDRHGVVTVDGRRVLVPWSALNPTTSPYGRMRTGREAADMTSTIQEMTAPNVSGVAHWYEATVDGETYAPHIRTGDNPTFMLLVKRDADGPWEPVGFSTGTKDEALADAEAIAPRAAAHTVAVPTVRTDPPPTTVRTVNFKVDPDDEWGHFDSHTRVLVNDKLAGIVRHDPDTDRWVAVNRGWNNLNGDGYASKTDAVDAVTAAMLDDTPSDTPGHFTRTAVPVDAAANMRAKVEKLNKRAEKKGLTGRVSFEVGEPYVAESTNEDGFTYKYQAVDVSVSSTPVVLGGGWEFAGVVDYAATGSQDEGILHSTSGYQLPSEFRGAAVCDDCGRVMPRNKLIVAADKDGNLTRLGTTCVRDVLGHNPENLIWFGALLDDLADDEEWGGGGNPPPAWTHEDFLTDAFIAVDEFGWRSSKYDGYTTKAMIVDLTTPPRGKEPDELKQLRELVQDPERRAAALAKAQAAIAFLTGPEYTGRQEFDDNMRAFMRADFVTTRAAGTLAYVPAMIAKRDEQARAAAPNTEVPNEWIGKIGDKIEMVGTVRAVRKYDSDYGTRAAITVDTADGATVTHTSAGTEFADAAETAMDAGVPIKIAGTVKDHNTWPRGSDNKQTVLTRVKPVLTRSDRLRQSLAAAEQARVQAESDVLYDVRNAAPKGDGRDVYLDAVTPRVVGLSAAKLQAVKDAVDAAEARHHESAPRGMPTVGMQVQARRLDDYDSTTHSLVKTQRRVITTDGHVGTLRDDGNGGVNLVDPAGNVLVSGDEIHTHGVTALDYWSVYTVDPDPERNPPPWADTPVDVTMQDGSTVRIGTDGLVTRDGTPVSTSEHRDAWTRAFRDAEVARQDANRAELQAVIDEALNQPAPVEDVGLTPEWIDAGPWPTDYTYRKKVYRIEAGGDVVLDGKRVTDRTGDKVLLAALTDLAPQPDVPASTPDPAVTSIDPPVIQEMAVPPTVGSDRVDEIRGTPSHDAYRLAVGHDAELTALGAAWDNHAAGVQLVAAGVFDRPSGPIGPDSGSAATDVQILDATAGNSAKTLTRLHDATQRLLADNGIHPDQTLTLYRTVTPAQVDEWVRAGEPSTLDTVPLVSFTPRFTVAAGHAPDGAVFTVDVPAANVVAYGAYGDPGEIIAFPPPGGFPIVRARTETTDILTAAPPVVQHMETAPAVQRLNGTPPAQILFNAYHVGAVVHTIDELRTVPEGAPYSLIDANGVRWDHPGQGYGLVRNDMPATVTPGSMASIDYTKDPETVLQAGPVTVISVGRPNSIDGVQPGAEHQVAALRNMILASDTTPGVQSVVWGTNTPTTMWFADEFLRTVMRAEREGSLPDSTDRDVQAFRNTVKRAVPGSGRARTKVPVPFYLLETTTTPGMYAKVTESWSTVPPSPDAEPVALSPAMMIGAVNGPDGTPRFAWTTRDSDHHPRAFPDGTDVTPKTDRETFVESLDRGIVDGSPLWEADSMRGGTPHDMLVEALTPKSGVTDGWATIRGVALTAADPRPILGVAIGPSGEVGVSIYPPGQGDLSPQRIASQPGTVVFSIDDPLLPRAVALAAGVRHEVALREAAANHHTGASQAIMAGTPVGAYIDRMQRESNRLRDTLPTPFTATYNETDGSWVPSTSPDAVTLTEAELRSANVDVDPAGQIHVWMPGAMNAHRFGWSTDYTTVDDPTAPFEARVAALAEQGVTLRRMLTGATPAAWFGGTSVPDDDMIAAIGDGTMADGKVMDTHRRVLMVEEYGRRIHELTKHRMTEIAVSRNPYTREQSDLVFNAVFTGATERALRRDITDDTNRFPNDERILAAVDGTGPRPYVTQIGQTSDQRTVAATFSFLDGTDPVRITYRRPHGSDEVLRTVNERPPLVLHTDSHLAEAAAAKSAMLTLEPELKPREPVVDAKSGYSTATTVEVMNALTETGAAGMRWTDVGLNDEGVPTLSLSSVTLSGVRTGKAKGRGHATFVFTNKFGVTHRVVSYDDGVTELYRGNKQRPSDRANGRLETAQHAALVELAKRLIREDPSKAKRKPKALKTSDEATAGLIAMPAFHEVMAGLGVDMGTDETLRVAQGEAPLGPLADASGKVKTAAEVGLLAYPKSWTTHLARNRAVRLRLRTGMGNSRYAGVNYYPGGGSKANLDADTIETVDPQVSNGYLSTWGHEFGHSMQRAIDGLPAAERWYMAARLARTSDPARRKPKVYGRTKGLSPDYVYPDEWADEYTSRTYGDTFQNSRSLEVVTTAVQGLYEHDESRGVAREGFASDPGLQGWLVGLMALHDQAGNLTDVSKVNVGEVFTVGSVQIRRTPDGFVDVATGTPVNRFGVALTS